MKKLFIISSLITSLTMASTIGNVEVFNKTEGKNIKEFKVSTDVAVVDTGFSFGGELKLKDVKKKIDLLKDSSAYIKYQFPRIKKVDTSLKIDGSIKKIGIEGSATYTPIKDVKLKFNGKFDVNISNNNTMEHKKYEEDIFEETFGDVGNYLQDYDVNIEYTGVKGLKLSFSPFISHQYANEHKLAYGLKMDSIYTGVKGLNVASGLLLFNSTSNIGEFTQNEALFKVDNNIKYNYTIKNFTFTPEIYTMTKFKFWDTPSNVCVTINPKFSIMYNYINKLKISAGLEAPSEFLDLEESVKKLNISIKPNVGLEYNISKNLKFNGKIEVPIIFNGNVGRMMYKETKFNTEFGVKYMW